MSIDIFVSGYMPCQQDTNVKNETHLSLEVFENNLKLIVIFHWLTSLIILLLPCFLSLIL